MLTLESPWLLLALPLPLLIYRFGLAYRTRHQALKVPFFNTLLKALNEKPQSGAQQLEPMLWQRVLLPLSWLLIVIALAQPTWLGPAQTREEFGRDLMVVLDLSGSMAQEDFVDAAGRSQSRLSAAKQVLSKFVADRHKDRIGLILFGDAAFVQAPFTADHDAWLQMIEQTEVAMAGPSTHLGDAIGLAIKTFEQTDLGRDKVAIVLTDGNDTESVVPPLDAAKVAAAKGVRLHTVAMGDPDNVGEQPIDIELLTLIAESTGGELFLAQDSASLQHAYQAIAALEPQRYNSVSFRPKQALHHWPVAIVLISYLLAFSASMSKRIRTQGDVRRQQERPL